MHSLHYHAINIGTTLANLSSERNIPDLSEELMRNVKSLYEFLYTKFSNKSVYEIYYLCTRNVKNCYTIIDVANIVKRIYNEVNVLGELRTN